MTETGEFCKDDPIPSLSIEGSCAGLLIASFGLFYCVLMCVVSSPDIPSARLSKDLAEVKLKNLNSNSSFVEKYKPKREFERKSVF